MTQVSDVAILGAGAVGCATAYFLARQGVKVTVLEREAAGSGASGYALGLLNPLTGAGIPGPAQPFAEAAFKMHRELWPLLKEEADTNFHGTMVPHLELCIADDEVHEGQEEMRRWAKVDGFSARWLEPEQVLNLEPRITQEVSGAVLVENLGSLDSYRYTRALAEAAERHGAEFVRDQVVGLRSQANRVTAVAFNGGEFACDATVVALGPWSGQAAQWLGVDVPVGPLKGQILHLEGQDPPLPYHVTGPVSIVQKSDGMLWVGSTEEEAGFDLNTTAQARQFLMRGVLRMFPGLAEARLVRQTACLRPVTPDLQPILGQAPGWDGVYLATGAAKKGILYSPAMGRAVADMITTGHTSLPIAPFAPERFVA